MSPRLACDYARYRAALRRHDWTALRAMLRPLVDAARRAQDFRMLGELGHAAWRLDEYQLGIELIHAASRRDDATKAGEWRGEDIRDATLVVKLMDTTKQGVAIGMGLAGYIRAASSRAAKTIVIVEPRMVALFMRTLPELIVLPFGADFASHVSGRCVTANSVDLQFILGCDAQSLARLHVPLVADQEMTRSMRQAYLKGRELPLVGIAWWSSHYGKDLPSLAHWARLVGAIPAQFVSLQYGDVAEQIAVLQGDAPQRLIVDPAVDQLVDMDRFASQIAALDLVITISNSGAHLSGALGQRMILVRDDLFRRDWPYLSRSVPWFPATTVIGKNGRPWDATFDEIIETARAIITRRDESRGVAT